MTSDASFPFGGPEPQAAPVETGGEGGSRRNLVLGGALGVLALGAAGFLFLGGGGDAEEEAFVVPTSRQAAAAPQAAAPAPVEVVPAASTEQFGRNPFKPRYVEPKAVAAPAVPAQPTAQPTVAPTSLPLPPVQVVVTQPAPTQAPAEYPITFVSTSEAGGAKTYTWRLDGAKDTVTVLQGQRFGKYGELVVLALATGDGGAPEAVLQVGDSSPVRVKLDETIKVL